MLIFKSKNRLFLYAFLILSIFIFIVYRVLSDYTLSVEYAWPMGRNGIRYILYWDTMWEFEDYGFGYGNDIFKHCLVNNCYTTKDKNLIPLEEFDALLFHGVQFYQRIGNAPPKREPNQVYIYYSLESPSTTPAYHTKSSSGFFNWTLTYRSDSEVQRPYGRIIRKNTNYKLPSAEEIRKRPKKISWFVSRCGMPNKRDELAQKINQYMSVDIYGKCGTLECSRDDLNECYKMIERNYKFYLSFENSVCKDYVTEKLFNLLRLNIVPIVYGGADYDKIAPPHSVIDVTKYKTVKELTDYLDLLDQHPEEYLKYFEWKKSYSVDTMPYDTLCQLCQKLNEPRKTIFYDDIVAWVNYPAYCKSGDSLPPIIFS